MWELAAVVLFATVAAPLAKVCVTTTVLLGAHQQHPPDWLRGLFAWAERLRPWSMIEVYLLSVFVAYVQLGTEVHIELGAALYALAALMVVMVAADYTLDAEAVWDVMDRRRSLALEDAYRLASPRRPADGLRHLPLRHPHGSRHALPALRLSAAGTASRTAIARTWALGFAALILYIPANVYPVLTVISAGRRLAQHHPGRRARAAGGRHVAARGAGVLRQHPGAGAEADRADHPAGFHVRPGRRAACATARGCTASSTTSAAGR